MKPLTRYDFYAMALMCGIMPIAVMFSLVYLTEHRLGIMGLTRRFFHEHQKVIRYDSGVAIYEDNNLNKPTDK